ncbi:DUF475 domain-containing protein [Arthrobacter sp. NQ7]|uniref:DUF475 domain-containing protein n=1 Tax=Arthrobacter sp. NQ7 TaxID=3032303 RepID=UPI0024100452|nr:DUF475 domain-containing protein [Arthrobacter sp. NQ7]MDJ0457699.1 DUF475 domain-containing protein [Arthrobacter sp. NQ7]
MLVRTFGWSLGVTAAALAVAFVYGGPQALTLCLILGILEISLSFDNAVVNARILERMNPFWQRMFLTVGVVIAVFGMRVLFPLLIVGVTAHLNPVEAVNLALQKGDPHTAGTYGYLLHEAHPQIAAFGGLFLLMIFLDFIFEERDLKWIKVLEVPLARFGKLEGASMVTALAVLTIAGFLVGEKQGIVLLAGLLGMITYLLVNGLGNVFNVDEDADDEADELPVVTRPRASAGRVAGKAALMLFLYLEVIDASFSFDGVIGAFAVTADPIIIALGLGLIGAMFVRSLTVYLVREGTLDEFEFLDHGAHWAIGALAIILLVTITAPVNEVVTGLIGVIFIGAAFAGSVLRNRKTRVSDSKPEALSSTPA